MIDAKIGQRVAYSKEAIEMGIGGESKIGTVVSIKQKGKGFLLIIRWDGEKEYGIVNQHWVEAIDETP